MTIQTAPSKSKTCLRFWGHAAVSITAADGRRLLVDPYESGGLGGALRYAPIDDEHDWVVATHGHADHSAFDRVVGSTLDDEATQAGPFGLARTRVAHDEYDGRRFGGWVDILEITIDGHRILHLSDVGSAPIEDVLERHRGADIVLVPTGGFFTIGAAQAEEWVRRLEAKCVIPIHAKTADCDLPIRDSNPFLARFVEYSELATSFLSVDDALALGPVITLKPAGAKTM